VGGLWNEGVSSFYLVASEQFSEGCRRNAVLLVIGRFAVHSSVWKKGYLVMIRFISGKPGAGKTLYAVLRLVDELRMTNRAVVTNMAIELHPWVDGGGVPRLGLLQSLQKEFGSTFDAEDRLYLLSDEQVKRFYAWRPEVDDGVIRFRELPLDGPQRQARFKLTKGVPGVAYFIDEAHEFFASRDWQETGKETLSWASQQRRAGDDAWLLTQVVGNVEKQLRGVSQECVWLVNHRLQSLAMFRQPDMLSYRVFSSTPPAPSEHWLTAGKVSS